MISTRVILPSVLFALFMGLFSSRTMASSVGVESCISVLGGDGFTWTVEKAVTQVKATLVLNRFLSADEVDGVFLAHLTGLGEVGTDGGPARVGFYTESQLRTKAEILRDYGFNQNERELLIRSGTAGLLGDIGKRFFPSKSDRARAEARILAAGNSSGFDKLNDLQKLHPFTSRETLARELTRTMDNGFSQGKAAAIVSGAHESGVAVDQLTQAIVEREKMDAGYYVYERDLSAPRKP